MNFPESVINTASFILDWAKSKHRIKQFAMFYGLYGAGDIRIREISPISRPFIFRLTLFYRYGHIPIIKVQVTGECTLNEGAETNL